MSSTHAHSEMLTVTEAARLLGIGRTLAYRLTTRFLDGEPGGLPVVRLGSCLRVPRWAVDELIHGVGVAGADVRSGAPTGEATRAPAGSAGAGAVPRRRRRAGAKRRGAQLSLPRPSKSRRQRLITSPTRPRTASRSTNPTASSSNGPSGSSPQSTLGPPGCQAGIAPPVSSPRLPKRSPMPASNNASAAPMAASGRYGKRCSIR